MPRYTPKELYDNYRQGFSGCLFEQHIYDALMEHSKYPLFGNANKKIKNSGKGKLSTPYKSVLKFDKNPYNERQTTGDCQNGSDLVRMADGSTKMIKDIKVNEYIISANGNKKRVLRTIKKPYNGKMVQIKVDGYCQTIASTPDHRYIVDPINTEYKAIAALEVGDSVYLPSINYEEPNIVFDMMNYFDGEVITHDTDTKSLRLEPVDKDQIRAKNGRSTINRYIKLDEKLSWLVGLYAAEGGVDGVSNKQERITYNLGSHEAIMAEQVRQYFKDIFDIDAHLYQVPSKPTVIYVRINSVFVASLFKSLCSGNTYSKKLNNKFFITSKSNKLSLLKGWFDGDGHKGKSCSTAVSVSKQLVTDFADIANSVNLSIAIRYRKAYAHSKESYALIIKSQHSNQFNITKGQYVANILNCNTLYSGRMVKIKHIQIVEPEDKFVYCIEVADDHNFICNGYGISNCVSHGTRNACDVSRAVEIDVHNERESWIARGATEAIYGYRGFSGQGMSCARAAEFVSKVGGIVVRKNYGFVDFSKYNGNLGAGWGGRGLPDKVLDLSNDHQMKTASLIRTVEEARDALANGYGVNVCSNYGFSNTRDKKGFARTSGNWAHSMAWIACDDTGDEPAFLVQNSWGKWNDGGHPEWGPIPEGSFLIHADVAAGMLSANGSYAFSGFDGFPLQKLPSYGFDDYL